MHSTASDGTDNPAELPALAKSAGLDAIALTDHDTTAGLPDAAAAAARIGLTFIPGIELSADPAVLANDNSDSAPRRGTLHILGYFVEHDAPGLVEIGVRLRQARAQRNPEIVDNLQKLGVRITYDQVLEVAGAVDDESVIVGRPHIAQVLVDKGYVRSIHEAFARYIGEGAAAYARKDRLSAKQAIDAIRQAGGLAVLAHPVQLRGLSHDELEMLVRRMRDIGLVGIETRHSDHSPADVNRLTGLAKRLDLITTGGSDYHGSRKSIRIGEPAVPISVSEQLHAAHERLKR